MKNKGLIIVFIIIQVIIIVVMIGKSMLPLINGTPIELAVQARDPRDIFRGDYVVLNYSFNTLEIDSIPNDLKENKKYRFGDELYLELKQKNKYYEPVGLWENFPAENGNIVLKAIVQERYGYFKTGGDGWIYLKCGIESYFTDSKQAKEIEEKLLRRGSLTAQNPVAVTVMVAKNGDARIKQINYPE